MTPPPSSNGDTTRVGGRNTGFRTDPNQGYAPKRTSLGDVYRKTPEPSPNGGTQRNPAAPLLRDSLAQRYRNHVAGDVDAAPGVQPKPIAPSPKPGAGVDTAPKGTGPRPLPPSGDSPRVNPPRVNPPRVNPPGSGGSSGGDLVAKTPGKASHRYLTPTSTPSPKLTPVQPRGTPISLSPAPRGPSPRLVPRTAPPTRIWSPRSSSGYPGYYAPRSWFLGSNSWYGNSLSLSFCFGWTPRWCGGWGLYSYPYYFGWSWPTYYWCQRRSFGFYWNSCYSWADPCWYWPSSYYQPTVYLSYRAYDDSYQPGAYYGASYAGGSIVVHDEPAAPAAEPSEGEADEVVVAGGAAPDPAAKDKPTSRATLAAHHVTLGDFYFKEERFQEASESYLRALAYAPDDATIHFVTADALFATGDYHYAAFMIAKGLRLEPELARATADKRTFYRNPATFEAQLETLRGYIKDKPYDAAAHLVLGYNLRFSGRGEDAKVLLQRVLTIEPDHEAATLLLDGLAATGARGPL